MTNVALCGLELQVARPDDPDADLPVDEAFAGAYPELRRLARARLRGGGRDAVLDTTALVHETYLKLSGHDSVSFPDRARFLVYAGKAMRSVIVDMVRQRQTERRGGRVQHLTLTGDVIEQAGLPADEAHILAVNEALEELAQVDARMAQVVEMRYFGGLTDAEIADALGVGERTVRRDWEQARLFLAEALK
ncbi:MAG: ECF-type sigma factor [Rubrivivax sp.]|nr:ECF-type sigma factor [Rubrivivax sp.]